MLNKVKVALMLTDSTFDGELNSYISEAVKDMGFAGITEQTITTAGTNFPYEQCIVLYCVYRFELLHGSSSKADAIKKCYDEQKKQLGMATGYTEF